MKSRMGLILIALVAALAIYVPVGAMTARNVRAYNNCQFSDQNDTVYQNGYVNSWYQVEDLNTLTWHTLGSDIIQYRAMHNGVCHIGFYSSVYMQGLSVNCYCEPHLRVWIGGLDGEFDSGNPIPSGWGPFARLSSYHWGNADWSTWVDIPHGGGVVDFRAIGSNAWSASNEISQARLDYNYSPPLPNWDTWPYACLWSGCSPQSQSWWESIGNP